MKTDHATFRALRARVTASNSGATIELPVALIATLLEDAEAGAAETQRDNDVRNRLALVEGSFFGREETT